jgi:hypothetical protein
MGMSTNYNPAMFEARLNQIGERAIRGMSERMRHTAVKIRDLAREYAPYKTGLLEKSIDYMTIRDGRNRNAYIVFIDLDAARLGTREGQLGDYAWIMHGSLRPYGNKGKPLHLGPGSVAKAAGGRKVGGRFLTRAVTEAIKNLRADMAHEVRKVTGGSSVGVSYRRGNQQDYPE